MVPRFLYIDEVSAYKTVNAMLNAASPRTQPRHNTKNTLTVVTQEDTIHKQKTHPTFVTQELLSHKHTRPTNKTLTVVTQELL